MTRGAILSYLFLACISSAVTATNIEGRIVWNDVCADYASLGPSKAVLDNGRLRASITKDGTFSIPDVTNGSYILNINSPSVTFDTFRIDVPQAGDGFPEVRPYLVGTPHNPPPPVSLPYPIVLIPREKRAFFVDRESFSVLTMLKNPMILMMVATGGLVLGMPYIMKNLDPELANEVQQKQAKFSGVQQSLTSGDFRGGLSALLAPDVDPHDSPAPPANSKKNSSVSGSGAPSNRGRGGLKGRRK